MDTLGTIIANMSSADQRSSLLPSELNRVYHLVKPETGYEGEEGGPHQGARIMSEVFLTRLLSTKVKMGGREGGREEGGGEREGGQAGRQVLDRKENCRARSKGGGGGEEMQTSLIETD